MKFASTITALACAAIAAADSLHLANSNLWYSEVIYYANDADSNGKEPSSNDVCQFVGTSDYVKWETHQQCRFGTGVTVNTYIEPNAASYATGRYAGYATNGYKTFTCYKDNGRWLYSSGTAVYNSLYYCLS